MMNLLIYFTNKLINWAITKGPSNLGYTELMGHAWITPKQFSFDVTFLHQQGAWLLVYYKSFLT